MNKYTIKQWQDKTNKLYGWNRFEIIKVGYDGAIDTGSIVKCKTCNTKFECSLAYFTGKEKPGCMAGIKHGRSTCVMKTLEYAQARVNEVHGYNKITVKYYSGNSGDKSQFECCSCNTIWATKLGHIVSGAGCPRCAGTMQIKNIEDVADRMPNTIRCTKYGGSSKSLSVFSCTICYHTWTCALSPIINGKTGCPKCAGVAKIDTVEKAADRLPDTIDILYYAGNVRDKSTLRCNICDTVWSVVLRSILNNGTGCPTCNNKKYKGETYIANILDKMNVPYETQKKFKGLGQKRFDFYIPCIKAVIEFNGQQHYKPDHYWNKKAKEGFWGGVFISDIAKRIYCKANGIRFIEIDNANKDWQMWTELYLQSLLAEKDY